jgi:hypothetical protein
MRVARGLLGERHPEQAGKHLEPGVVGAGVSRVRNALHLAAGPLRLNRVPTRTQVERALLGWVRGRGSRAGRGGATAGPGPSTSAVR